MEEYQGALIRLLWLRRDKIQNTQPGAKFQDGVSATFAGTFVVRTSGDTEIPPHISRFTFELQVLDNCR